MGYEFNHFRKTVTTAGTAEALQAAGFVVKSAVIQAETDNSTNVFIGGSAVDSTGFALEPGESFSLPLDSVEGDDGGHDLSQIYIDVGTNGDGVNVVYVRE